MVPDVDVAVLSQAERAEYARLVRATRRRVGVVPTLVWSAAAVGLVVAGAVASERDTAAWVDGLLLVLVLGAVGRAVVCGARSGPDTRHARRKADAQLRGFLERVGYASRLDDRRVWSGRGRQVPWSDDDGGEVLSRRQMQHRWYGDRSELGWRDRELAEAWGMDADTYVSNFLEHDKD